MAVQEPDGIVAEVGRVSTGGPDAPPGAGERWVDRAFVAAVIVSLVPVVAAVVRAAVRGWEPVSDNGYFAVRARDVLTEHHPLLGTWTSASENTGTDFNNPGPLFFDVLALPAKLVDAGIGVALGAALLNVLALVGIAVAARRRGGPLVGIAAVTVASVLAWTLGSELLVDPWQPNALLLTFLLLAVLGWSVADGDLVALPWAVAVASLVVQTHLSYTFLVAGLAAWSVTALALRLRRDRRKEPEAWPGVRRSVLRTVAVAVAVAALCWVQPLVEQVQRGGDGNLARLAASATDAPTVVGPEVAARVMAPVLAVPPLWLRHSFGGGSFVPPLGSTVLAVAALVAVAAVLAAAWWSARRRGDHHAATATGAAIVVVSAAYATMARLPVGDFGLPPHHIRWLWPTAAFATLALIVTVLGRTAVGRRGRRRAAAVLGGVLVAAAGHNVVPYNAATGPSADTWAFPVVRELRPQMAALETGRPVLVDLTGLRFGEPYSGAVMVELQRRGIPLVVDDETLVRQLGEGRRRRVEADRLLIREGDAAVGTIPGARRVALVEGLAEREVRELDRLRAAVAADLERRGRLPLRNEGEALLFAGEVGAGHVRDHDVAGLLGDRTLRELVVRGFVAVGSPWAERYERYAELQLAWDRRTVALFVVPTGTEEDG